MVNLFSQDMGLRASVGLFLLSCIFLTSTYTTTFAFDHPVTSALLACHLAGISLLILSIFIKPDTNPSSPHKYTSIPLTERDEPTAEIPPSPVEPISRRFNWPRWIRVALVSAAGCTRIALYRDSTFHIGCAPPGYTYTIPFLIALYDYWRNQRSRSPQRWVPPDWPDNARLRRVVALYNRVHFYLCRTRFRHILAAVLLMIGGRITSDFQLARQSTYICPITSGHYTRLRTFKIMSAILDAVILIAAAEISSSQKGVRRRDTRKQAVVSWGVGFLGVGLIWTIRALIVAIFKPGDDGGFVSAYFLRSSAGQVVLVAFVIVSASQLIPTYGAVGLSIVGGFIAIYFTWSSTLFNGQEPFPLIYPSHALAALFSSFFGVMIFLSGRVSCEDEPQPLYIFNIVMRAFFSLLFGIGLILVAHQPSMAGLHPIDLLIYEGRQRHDKWQAQAKGSTNLAEAVEQYRNRYHQHPPPGFDKWYEYATSRNSMVIDEFDQIHDNLLPFRALEPQQIRDATQLLSTNPYNSIGSLMIRNGTVHIQDGIKPTHAWMVIGAGEIIEKFAQHLPDMDLAFNLDDEPRVSVPWEKMTVFKNHARSQEMIPAEGVSKEWSIDRNQTWPPIEPADQTTDTPFVDNSFQYIFDRYVSTLCPPSSKARSQRIWDKSSVCVSCIRPHSMGQFPKNWHTATDICHQPDLAYMHGFFMSPASFKVSQDLVPVFSQSAIAGFSDILFPSPWNYVDKSNYAPSDEFPDPDYEYKDNTLFWIGATSEGVSRGGQWKGMPRQRLTHLVNNNTYSKVSVLLPNEGSATSNPSYTYQILPGQSPRSDLGLNATVSLGVVLRCDWGDCEEETEEFQPSGHVDFQGHWRYRYLFDADGAGFSGRFLPFMLSHSLPFKTGLFRQWFDSRISAWLHFAPIDIRMHGLWSTLAYFAGVDVTVSTDSIGKNEVLMKPHDTQGKWIAEAGRKWAQQALRKEDMEIYFFRLLLEWGRLTDDRRDELGFTL